MNPLSALTYYRRHKRQALLLVGLIAALTVGVYTMTNTLSIVLKNDFYPLHYLTKMSLVSDDEAGSSGTTISAQIRAREDVAHVFPENGFSITVPVSDLGVPSGFPVLGIAESDLPVVMEICDLRLKEGRLIAPRASEIVLSEELARTLGLQIGDPISYEINETYYADVATELTLVGVLESVSSEAEEAEFPVRAGFVSYEYLEGHNCTNRVHPGCSSFPVREIERR